MSLVDIHNHLVPGVDDGARNVEEAVSALDGLADAGVTAVVTTPHFDGSLTHHDAAQAERLAELDRGWERLLAAEGRPDVALYRGVEVRLDVPDPRADDPRLRINGGPLVLVEFPYMTVPPGATQPLERLRADGWIPVLAHPERYHGAGSSREAVVASAREWRRAGAYLQVNGAALIGRYGPEARMRAFVLLESGLVDYLGSDYHARGKNGIPEYRAVLEERGAMEAWSLLTDTNPTRMIHGKPPLPVPPVRSSSRGRSWVKRVLGR